MKKRLGPSDTLFPVPAALVVSGTMERPNVITIAWIGIMSSTPPTVGISLRKNRWSLGLIRSSGEFTVNIPSADLFTEVDYCGLVSGREADKFERAGLTPLEGAETSVPIIKECPYNIECRVTTEHEIGDWVMVLGEVVQTHVDADKVGEGGQADISLVDPLVYCANIREYWRLGAKLGDGFEAGRALIG